MNILAIDTGSKGAAVLLDDRGEPIAARALPGTKSKKYWQALIDFIESCKRCGEFEAVVEKVWGMPGQAGASTIARNFGMVIGILRANNIEAMEVVPQVWQKPFVKQREKPEKGERKKESDMDRKARMNVNRVERKQELIDAAASIYGRLIDHSGIADALLIGRHRWMVRCGQIPGDKPKKKKNRKNNKGVKK